MNAPTTPAHAAVLKFAQGLGLRITAANERTAVIDRYGFDLECTYEFHEAEPATALEPGCPPMVTFLTAKAGGVDLTEMIECAGREFIESIEEKILEQLESSHG